MKKLIVSVLAMTLLSSTAAMAQHYQRDQHRGPGWRAPQQKVFIKKQRWHRGAVLPGQYRRSYVNDYGRYRLRPPPRGHRWVRVDNQFILISIAGGLIAGFGN